MAYAGYNLKINGVVIPNAIIRSGSYEHVPMKRLRSDREDANGIHHMKFYPTARHKITFTIKERTRGQHETIRAAFGTRNGATVKFWSEDDDDYLTGTFDISAPAWQHSYDSNETFYYADSKIELIQR